MAGISAVIGFLLLDTKSALENAISAVVVGLSAVFVWQVVKFVWRFGWSVPRELEQERDRALAQLESSTGLPLYRPVVVPHEYGTQGSTSHGLFIANDGYAAYDVAIADAHFGQLGSRMTFARTLPRLIDKDGRKFFEAWLEHPERPGSDGGRLHGEMVKANVDAVSIGIVYKDNECHWYRSNCLIIRDSSERNGLRVMFVGQELIPNPIAKSS